MIDFKAYKRIYTNGDMFTLTGSDFYGGIEYRDGKTFAENTDILLTPKNTFNTDIFTSSIFFDRVVSDFNITLPTTIDECLFSLNDELSYESFKYRLDKIRYNTNYVYSRLFIPTTDLPSSDIITYACLTGIQDNELTTRTVSITAPVFLESTLFSQNSTFEQLHYITDATAQPNYEFEDRYTWFAVASSTLISLTGSLTSISIIEQSNYIESSENEVTFGVLGGIASTDKFLFVTDTTNNTIYKYDITGYLNNDSVLGNKRNFIEMIGGTGDSFDKFNDISKIACNGERLAVYDSGNRALKFYDINFNYITKNRGIREPIFCMGFDPFFKNLYAITASQNIMYLYRFDECFTTYEKIELKERLIGEEIPAQVEFSRNHSNFWYLATNRRVFKKTKTRPAEFVGLFDERKLFSQSLTWSLSGTLSRTVNTYWNNTAAPFIGASYRFNLLSDGCQTETSLSASGITDRSFKGISIFNSVQDKDRIVLLSDSRLYFFYEPNEYERVIKEKNYTNYGVNGFGLNPEEYIQTSSINSEIYKAVYDILTLKNNIIGRFSGKIENDFTILDNYNYNLKFNDFIDSEDREFYIQGNEKNILGAVNRVLRKIYDLQLKLVNLISIDISKLPQPSINSSSTIEI